MLTKDLLRVSRAGGGYQPRFADGEDEALAARVIGTFQGHLEQPRTALQEALAALEREASDFKLVRGFAKLVEREATFETRAPVDPRRAREAAFAAAAGVGVVTPEERGHALENAAARLDCTPDEIEESLYADREQNQVLTELAVRWEPAELVAQYNLSLAQTALFDATEVRIRASDPRAVVSAVKRLRLMYEIRRTEDGREVVVTGPDALFRTSRRYGTRFARLLRTVAGTVEWELTATINDRGTERELRLTDADVSVPDAEPVTEMTFDSGVEADFATRFRSLDLDWELVREPEPLAAGAHVVIPDFAFDYEFADFRVFFEIMGFWTPEYVEKKLERLAAVEDVEMLVAVDESLGVGEEIDARDHRAIPYSSTVRLKDVRRALRRYEDDLTTDAAASLPDDLVPEEDVIDLESLADRHGVSVSALEGKKFRDHARVGRTLIRPSVISSLEGNISEGMDLAAAEAVLDEYGIDDASAILSRLGYRVAWEGLGGGTVREK
ncbi:DUF790 family protein [Halorientalis halophila]|uniref:DUF790 family protein n=1 Tax=Halorientalis halophila TaxID=3108499 RepID=UPI0030094DBC